MDIYSHDISPPPHQPTMRGFAPGPLAIWEASGPCSATSMASWRCTSKYQLVIHKPTPSSLGFTQVDILTLKLIIEYNNEYIEYQLESQIYWIVINWFWFDHRYDAFSCDRIKASILTMVAYWRFDGETIWKDRKPMANTCWQWSIMNVVDIQMTNVFETKCKPNYCPTSLEKARPHVRFHHRSPGTLSKVSILWSKKIDCQNYEGVVVMVSG